MREPTVPPPLGGLPGRRPSPRSPHPGRVHAAALPDGRARAATEPPSRPTAPPRRAAACFAPAPVTSAWMRWTIQLPPTLRRRIRHPGRGRPSRRPVAAPLAPRTALPGQLPSTSWRAPVQGQGPCRTGLPSAPARGPTLKPRPPEPTWTRPSCATITTTTAASARPGAGRAGDPAPPPCTGRARKPAARWMSAERAVKARVRRQPDFRDRRRTVQLQRSAVGRGAKPGERERHGRQARRRPNGGGATRGRPRGLRDRA